MTNTNVFPLLRIPHIFEALKELTRVQIEITDRERPNFTDSLEKAKDDINASASVVLLHTQHKPNTRV